MSQWIILFSENSNALSAIGSIASALAAIAALVVAAVTMWINKRLLDENKILRKAGTEPEVVAFLMPNDDNVNVINFVVANLGSGPAFDIIVTTNIDPATLKVKEAFFKLGFGTVPISVLPQGDRLTTLFAQGFEILSEPILPPFEVSISYRNIDNEIFKRKTTVDARQYSYVTRLRNSNEEKIVRSLDRISRSFESAVSGNYLRVETVTAKERSAREAEIIESFDLNR
ncbi:hypothetical protein IPV08_16825 [Methylobacterium sp. SD274]|uniref:hypothetical protein n=1 Tax=Methylobacterium sp. SD274 TaxID=2782009 RepID=UPI001A978E04|nr:hypothetical protein [Methylobacterium sp. SD274]MBO1021626.1 hypothetical protein [Methylobacterium sp. SD274]